MANNYYSPGDWNAVCYECGRKRKASTLKRHWQGYYVCPEHWEARHPQDFVRGIQEKVAPAWVQPRSVTYLFGDFILTDPLGDRWIMSESPDAITTEV
jgi:hypothetical protein